MSGLYEKLGFNFTSDKIKPLSDGAIRNLQMVSTIMRPWQEAAIINEDTSEYFYNPLANAMDQVISTCQIIDEYSNSCPELSGIKAIANTIYLYTAPDFKAHTDRISGVADINAVNEAGELIANTELPYYETATAVGRTLMYLTYQSDGIINDSPILGSFTSVLAKDEIIANCEVIYPYANTVKDSIISSTPQYAGEPLELVGWINVSNLSAETIANISSDLTELQTLLNTRRTHDENFYRNATNIMESMQTMDKFSNMGETQQYLINDFIGSEKLKTMLYLDSIDVQVPTDGTTADVPVANASVPVLMSTKIYKRTNELKHKVEIRYEGVKNYANCEIVAWWDNSVTKTTNGKGTEILRSNLTAEYGVFNLDLSLPSGYVDQPITSFVIRNKNGDLVSPSSFPTQVTFVTDNAEPWPPKIENTIPVKLPRPDLSKYAKIYSHDYSKFYKNSEELDPRKKIQFIFRSNNNYIINRSTTADILFTFKFKTTSDISSNYVFRCFTDGLIYPMKIAVSPVLGDFSDFAAYSSVVEGRTEIPPNDGFAVYPNPRFQSLLTNERHFSIFEQNRRQLKPGTWYYLNVIIPKVVSGETDSKADIVLGIYSAEASKEYDKAIKNLSDTWFGDSTLINENLEKIRQQANSNQTLQKSWQRIDNYGY